MTEAQRRYIDSHMLMSIADAINADMAPSFNPQDVIECLRRCAKIVAPKPEIVESDK